MIGGTFFGANFFGGLAPYPPGAATAHPTTLATTTTIPKPWVGPVVSKPELPAMFGGTFFGGTFFGGAQPITPGPWLVTLANFPAVLRPPTVSASPAPPDAPIPTWFGVTFPQGNDLTAFGEALLTVWSTDGKEWHYTNGGEQEAPNWAYADTQYAQNGNSGPQVHFRLRDPSVMYKGGYFWVVYTRPPNPPGGSPWNGKTFGIARCPATSADLMANNWQFVTAIDCSAIATNHFWAPKWFLDPGGNYWVIGSTDNTSVYMIEATDQTGFTAWNVAGASLLVSNTTAWVVSELGGGGTVYDPAAPVQDVEGNWHLFFTFIESGASNIHHTTCSTFNGSYSLGGNNLATQGFTTFEGPFVQKLPNGRWRMYCDTSGSAGTGACWSESADLNFWTPPTPLTLNGQQATTQPNGAQLRHGAYKPFGLTGSAFYDPTAAAAVAGLIGQGNLNTYTQFGFTTLGATLRPSFISLAQSAESLTGNPFWPNTTVAGDLLVVAIYVKTNTISPAPTFTVQSKPSNVNWTQIGVQRSVGDGARWAWVGLYYTIADGTETSVLFTATGPNVIGTPLPAIAEEFTGFIGTPTFDLTGSGLGSSTTFAGDTLSTPFADTPHNEMTVTALGVVGTFGSVTAAGCYWGSSTTAEGSALTAGTLLASWYNTIVTDQSGAGTNGWNWAWSTSAAFGTIGATFYDAYGVTFTTVTLQTFANFPAAAASASTTAPATLATVTTFPTTLVMPVQSGQAVVSDSLVYAAAVSDSLVYSATLADSLVYSGAVTDELVFSAALTDELVYAATVSDALVTAAATVTDALVYSAALSDSLVYAATVTDARAFGAAITDALVYNAAPSDALLYAAAVSDQ